jgi:bifunctional non-homologous end joining protein LigD
MHGKKLKGEFALVKTSYQGENSWLLIKHNDKYATPADVTEKDKSLYQRKQLHRWKRRAIKSGKATGSKKHQPQKTNHKN